MKAFVIKNENNNGWGKYFEIDGQDRCYTDNIAEAEIYSDYKSAKKHCLFNDDKPVEITIEETNQPTQTAIECLKETREYIFNAFMSVQPLLDICNFIENKIKELEEE